MDLHSLLPDVPASCVRKWYPDLCSGSGAQSAYTHVLLPLLASFLGSNSIISTVPKALSTFWLDDVDISFGGCVTLLFFMHFAFVVESGILLAMAFDHYVAICFSLRYTTILSHGVTGKISGVVVLRSFATVFPIVFPVKRLPFCQTNINAHTFCEHMGLAKPACADITISIWYGISVPLLSIMLDMVTIAISYRLILRAVSGFRSRMFE